MKEGLEIDVPHVIYLNKEKGIFVNVTLLDANHCIGMKISNMICFNLQDQQ